MAPIVVVQGTPVPHNQAFTGVASPPSHSTNNTNSHYNTNTHTNNNFSGNTNNDTTAADRADKVQTSCNDPIFAILFYIALFAIIGVAATYGVDAMNTTKTNTTGNTIDYQGYVAVTVIITVLSFFGAGAGMGLLFCIPQFLIKTALIFTVVLAGLWCAISFLTGNLIGGVIGVIFFAITVCYAYAVWSRIPFATANLVTACTAIRANLGVAIYAYIFAIFAGLWSVTWSLAVFGVFDDTYTCDEETKICSSPSYGILFVLFLALFFVQQVIQVRC
jgi:Plasma-membrane choline transporter